MNNVENHNIIEDSVIIHNSAVASDGRPLQRPPRASSFKYREAELSQLLDILQPGKVAVIRGMEGVGKTALAAEAVWSMTAGDKLPAEFPDGIIYHSFYNQPEAGMAFETIVRAFGHEPKPTPRVAVQNTLVGKRALLLLDGLDATPDANKTLQAILQVKGNCCVLLISKSPERKDIVDEEIELSPLEEDEAIELLQGWFLPQNADNPAVLQICNLVGRLPLAVQLAGRYLKETGETATDYLSWLTQAPLDASDPGRHKLEIVDELISCSLAQVSESASQLMGLLGRIALAPIDVRRLAVALNRPEDDLVESLDELVNYGLLSRREKWYEVSHALIHTYVSERIIPSSEVIESLAAYYTKIIDEQRKEGPEGCIRLENEREHILRVLTVCIEFSLLKTAYSLAWALKEYLSTQGRLTEEIMVDHAALDIACQMDDRREESAWLCNLGIACRGLGELGKAMDCHEQALSIDRKVSNRKGVADNLGNLGIVYRIMGEFDKSIDHHQQALRMDRKIEYHQDEAKNLYNLGVVYRTVEEYGNAIKYLLNALDIHKELGDRRNQADDLRNLGIAYRASGEMDKSIDCYQQALLIDKEIGNRRGEADNWFGLGVAYRAFNEFDKAIHHHQRAFVLARKIGDRQSEVDNLGNLGVAYQALGELDKATEYFQISLVIAKDISYRQGEADNLYNFGMVYHSLDDLEKAIEYFQEAVVILEEIKSPHGAIVRRHLSELTSRKSVRANVL